MSPDIRQPAGIPVGGQYAAHTRNESDATLPPAAPPVFPELNRARRRQKFFVAEMKKWPALGSTDGTPFPEKTIVGHFFAGPYDAYIAEYNPATGEAYGFVNSSGRPEDGQWGYIDLRYVESALVTQFRQAVERDMHWSKQQAATCIPKYLEQTRRQTQAAADLVNSFADNPKISLGTGPARQLVTDPMIDTEVDFRLGRRELSDVTALAICRYTFDGAEYPELHLLGHSGHGDRAVAYQELQRANERRSELRPAERNRIDMLFTWILRGGDND